MYNKVNNWFLNNGLHISLKSVVLANVDFLGKIVYKYRRFSYPSEIHYLVNVYQNLFAKSNKSIGSNYYNAVALCRKLGITVCPYCNRNFINNVDLGEQGIKRTSQLDHFYSKDKYPFLAMSFYNLIPSCPACNLLKHNRRISISPYDTRINFEKEIMVNYVPKSAIFFLKEEDIEVKLEYSDRMKRNINVFGLESQYLLHKDIVFFEIAKKCEFYSKSQLKEYKKNFGRLFKNEDEMKRVLFGNYLKPSDAYKRPLAKLTGDIYQRLVRP